MSAGFRHCEDSRVFVSPVTLVAMVTMESYVCEGV